MYTLEKPVCLSSVSITAGKTSGLISGVGGSGSGSASPSASGSASASASPSGSASVSGSASGARSVQPNWPTPGKRLMSGPLPPGAAYTRVCVG